jgi:hypothetical protein
MFPNSRQRRNALKARERLNASDKSWELEQEKNRKKEELDLSLQKVRTELTKELDNIQLAIKSCIKEHTQRLEKEMKEFMIKFEQDPSTELHPFQIEESFMSLLSDSKREFQEISEQIEFINGLSKKVSPDSQEIQNVSSDLPKIEISKQEQFFIDILSAYSFFRSNDVESVQRMINFCSNTRVCLEHLITYLNKFRSVMRNEINRQGKQPDFTIDPEVFESKHQQLEQFLQDLSKLIIEIEERKIPFFSITSLAEFIFSINPADFLSISEHTRRLENIIKDMKKIFCIKKESFVKFVQSHIDRCYNLVRYSHSGDSGGRSDDENPRYEDPVEEHRGNLEESLEQIRRTRV